MSHGAPVGGIAVAHLFALLKLDRVIWVAPEPDEGRGNGLQIPVEPGARGSDRTHDAWQAAKVRCVAKCQVLRAIVRGAAALGPGSGLVAREQRLRQPVPRQALAVGDGCARRLHLDRDGAVPDEKDLVEEEPAGVGGAGEARRLAAHILVGPLDAARANRGPRPISIGPGRARHALHLLAADIRVGARRAWDAGVGFCVHIGAGSADGAHAAGQDARRRVARRARVVGDGPDRQRAAGERVVEPVGGRAPLVVRVAEGGEGAGEGLRRPGRLHPHQPHNLHERERDAGVVRGDQRVVPGHHPAQEHEVHRFPRQDQGGRGEVVHDADGRGEDGHHALPLPPDGQAPHLQDGLRAGERDAGAGRAGGEAVAGRVGAEAVDGLARRGVEPARRAAHRQLAEPAARARRAVVGDVGDARARVGLEHRLVEAVLERGAGAGYVHGVGRDGLIFDQGGVGALHLVQDVRSRRRGELLGHGGEALRIGDGIGCRIRENPENVVINYLHFGTVRKRNDCWKDNICQCRYGVHIFVRSIPNVGTQACANKQSIFRKPQDLVEQVCLPNPGHDCMAKSLKFVPRIAA